MSISVGMNFFFNIFALVFHRILDFKPGLNFYSDPFLFLTPHAQLAGKDPDSKNLELARDLGA